MATGEGETFDPLLADDFAERLVARQVSEPLLARAQEPFVAAGSRATAGLATRAAPADGATVWRVSLRSGVRFQDGSRLDAAAVLANADRWQALGAPQVAGLLGTDSPKPGLVRFILAAPDRGFGAALAEPRLGLVSPRAIEADGTLAAGSASGSGAFELVGADGAAIELRRYDGWWGTSLELGPGFAALLVERTTAGEALGRLRRGAARLAGGLGAREMRLAARDPLLIQVGDGVVAERSLRGLSGPPEAPALSGAWSTDLTD
ncbi:hypothetical protein HJD18_05455 [Thermoleophilia bacterium SCSIO 60948]|nr:hypothetical protein HJD18_05455 [Thermoleophilia bacterium SCSIO 60948]